MSSPAPKKATAKKATKAAAAGGKKRKDPGAPKKPLTAYIIFSNAKREQVKKENPNIAFGQVAREISALWKSVTDSEKKKFEQAAADDKKRYEKEMADYEARGGAGDEEEAPKKKKAKAAPKKKAPEPEPESESESAESGSEEGSEDEE